MPKPIKKKVLKKTTSEIEVKGVISKLKESAAKRKSSLTAAISAFLVAAFAVAGFFIYNNNQKSSVQKLEYEGYKMYYGLYQKQPVTKEEQYKRAADTFKKAYDTRKSPVSLFYIANCYYETGKYDDALKTLKELNQKFPDDERFVPLAYYKMALANLRKGNSAEALNSLDILYKYKTGTFKDISLFESVKILESMGRTEEAKRKYEELKKDFPESPFIEEAQVKAGEKKS